MKKIIAVLAVGAVSAALFAQGFSFSAGVGGGWSPYFGTLKTTGAAPATTTTNYSNFGGKVFLDATYLEASAGYFTNTKYGNGVVGSWLGFDALAKYPIQLGPVTVFPMLGAGYNLCLDCKDASGTDLKKAASSAGYDLNQIVLKGGLGADIAVTEVMFFRVKTLCGYMLNSKATEAAASAAGGKMTQIVPEASLSIGFKL